MKKLFLIIVVNLLIFSCAIHQVGTPPDGVTNEPVPVAEVKAEAEPMLKYSDLNNMAPPSDRNYRRMTRKTMEEEAQLQASAGSLWVMEGQTSYLFSQNKHHNEGDSTSIKVEGTALRQIESKVAVIQDLLKELELQKIKADEDQKIQEKEKVRLAEEEKKIAEQAEWIAKNDPRYDPYEGQYPENPAAVAARQPASEKPAEIAKSNEKPEVLDLKEIEIIPSRIVEKTSDGMFRIRGQQYLTIKKRPYKVIATGLVRAEDFIDANISSAKLLDPQFDVIHIKRTE